MPIIPAVIDTDPLQRIITAKLPGNQSGKVERILLPGVQLFKGLCNGVPTSGIRLLFHIIIWLLVWFGLIVRFFSFEFLKQVIWGTPFQTNSSTPIILPERHINHNI